MLRNDSSELARLAEALDEFVDRNTLGDDIRFSLQLCLEELVLNIVNYGYDEPGEHEIALDLNLEEATRILAVHIVDDGREFDPFNDAPEPDIGASIQDREVGGLGIFFVRKFMDEVAYRREDGRNHLTLTKHVGD